MKTDSFMHRFFREFRGAFFTLIGEDESQAECYDFISVEVKEQAFRFDGVFKPQTNEGALFFFEAQFRPEDDFYLRYFGEIAVYLRQNKTAPPWRAIVLFPTKDFDPGVHPHYWEFFDSGRIRRVYLTDLPEAMLQKFPLNLFRIILDSEQKVLATAETIVRQLPQQNLNAKQQETIFELLINLLVSKLPEFSREELEKMFAPMLSDIKQSRFYREVTEEIAQELTPKLTQELTPKLTQELTPKLTQMRNREIAENLLRKKMSLKFVSEVTGLSHEEIRALKQAAVKH